MRTRSMASQPEPGPSTHGTAAPAAASPPAPMSASTHGTAAPAAAPPPASVSASTHGTAAPAPPPASVSVPVYRAIVQKCVALIDWWLVRGQGGKICVAGYIDKNRARRVFSSGPITMRHADGTLETADQKIVLTRGPLNIEQMHWNGFPCEVLEQFRLGFPIQWERYVNSNMKQANEHTLSPAKSIEYCVEKFLRGSFANSMEHTLTESDFRTSKESTRNTDGPGLPNYVKPRIQEPSGNSGDYDNSVSNMAASEGLCNDRMGTPGESFEDPGPGETCNGQASRAENSHEDIQTDANGQRIVTHSVDSALVNNDIDKIQEERGPSKLGNSSVCPGTEHVLEVQNKGVSSEHESVQCSSRLRSGKVYRMSNGASLKRGYSNRKTMQHETLSMKVMPTEEATTPAGPTCHKKGGSVAQITALDKLQSHDLGRKGMAASQPNKATTEWVEEKDAVGEEAGLWERAAKKLREEDAAKAERKKQEAAEAKRKEDIQMRIQYSNYQARLKREEKKRNEQRQKDFEAGCRKLWAEEAAKKEWAHQRFTERVIEEASRMRKREEEEEEERKKKKGKGPCSTQ